jgi:hypothetical protein
MIDAPGFPASELFNVNGAITHNQTDEFHQIAIAHYRQDRVIDFHSASSQIVGREDSLIAQSLQDAIVEDCFYFAISPAEESLRNYNYNLGSLKVKQPDLVIPKDLGTTTLGPNIGEAPNTILIGVEESNGQTSYGINPILISAGAGGGAGERTYIDESTGDVIFGRGGGGGGGPGIFLRGGTVNAGDLLRVTWGPPGAGGTANHPDGGDGGTAFLEIKRASSPTWRAFPIGATGINPSTPAKGGKGGVNGGDGGDIGSLDNDLSTAGGGGAAGFAPPGLGPVGINTPGKPGAQSSFNPNGATAGGFDPRNGGQSGIINDVISSPTLGGRGGNRMNTAMQGSGGGGGGYRGTEEEGEGTGGDGGDMGQPGGRGQDGGQQVGLGGQQVGSGGGGGSGGRPSSGDMMTMGGDGGNGGRAVLILLQSPS